MSTTDLRQVDVADVYKADRFAGTLTRAGNNVEFRYSPGYLDDPASADLAWSIPKSSVASIATGGSVPPFFAGLLPEGARLSGVVTAAKTSEDDHFTILLAVGSDTVGDVRVVPHGAQLTTTVAAFDPREPSPDFRALFDAVTGVGSLDLDATALPGVQGKVSAQMYSTPIATTTGPAILKLAPPARLPLLVQNEHFFMNAARAAGIATPHTRIIHDVNGIAALLVERFDRSENLRIPQEDACQVSSVYPAAKYRMKTEGVVQTLAGTVERGGGSARQTTLQLLRLTAYSYLIGNGDLHGKNYSIHLNERGLWSVTPGYDLLCTQPYAGWKDPMALNLFGRANRWNRAHVVESATRLGLPERATHRMLDEVIGGVRAAMLSVESIGFDDRETTRLSDFVTTRCRELSS
ncbi:type II toxin-antitoxin system HipA family toxin [Rhodococcus sp. P1Y]|uniref:type II toxin-antitoxin system HipA family toxin n=1 Tax=Rhodococcus sp. P1Y TaxID=1302308 RepID=UPI000EB3D55A|nr:type II toxin-antitoxin system HipA family toxin [Rhodococcus sp. P1Y]AYJ50451.1 type II toxin-antitoxin system HipA family toxin [Rhodococcus sp. P1Y]